MTFEERIARLGRELDELKKPISLPEQMFRKAASLKIIELRLQADKLEFQAEMIELALKEVQAKLTDQPQPSESSDKAKGEK